MRLAPFFALMMGALALAGCLDSPEKQDLAATEAEDWAEHAGCDWSYFRNDDLPQEDPCLPDFLYRGFQATPTDGPGLGARCAVQHPTPGLSEPKNHLWQWWWRPGQNAEGVPEEGFQNGIRYAFPEMTGPMYGAYTRTYPLDDADEPMLFWWTDEDWDGFVWFPENYQDQDVQWTALLFSGQAMRNGSSIDLPGWQLTASVVSTTLDPESTQIVPVAQVVHEGERYTFPFRGPRLIHGDNRELAGGGHWSTGVEGAQHIARKDSPDSLHNITLEALVSFDGHLEEVATTQSVCCPLSIMPDPATWATCPILGPTKP